MMLRPLWTWQWRRPHRMRIDLLSAFAESPMNQPQRRYRAPWRLTFIRARPGQFDRGFESPPRPFGPGHVFEQPSAIRRSAADQDSTRRHADPRSLMTCRSLTRASEASQAFIFFADSDTKLPGCGRLRECRRARACSQDRNSQTDRAFGTCGSTRISAAIRPSAHSSNTRRATMPSRSKPISLPMVFANLVAAALSREPFLVAR